MTVVPIEVVNSSIYVHGRVNGHPALFILDTGDAVGPVFNRIDARRFGLKQASPLQVSGAGGVSTSYVTEATVQLGDDIYQHESGAIDFDLEGASLLGLPFFLEKCDRLEFNFKAKTLTLTTEYASGGVIQQSDSAIVSGS